MLLQTGGCGEIAYGAFIVLDTGDAAIAIFEIMQGDHLFGMIVAYMVFDPYIMIEFARRLLYEGAIPFYIQVAAFTKGAGGNEGRHPPAGISAYDEAVMLELYILYLRLCKNL